MHSALLGESNAERAILGWLEGYELGQWEGCDRLAQASNLHDASFPRLYAEAVLWAEINTNLVTE